MFFDFTTAFIFLVVGSAFIAVNLVISRLLQPRHPSAVKLSTYECGELPVGQSWIQFNHRFYVIALVFLIFDVEIAFLFPWAAIYKSFVALKLGVAAFIEALVFVAILLVGLAYVWRKGDLEWDKPQTGKYARESAPEMFQDLPAAEKREEAVV